eukprot:TRINITY_DN1697_c0_g1_i1.p1 TRINITY_DN1697_c0_g1~~TRINITY_DN1697_c0_g1_i1.p1  ORF type:complete len:186 (-),score=27.33 TRINITY_DN1697_c0_g1_i1:53-610(-)
MQQAAGPVCAACGHQITDAVLNAFGLTYHPYHLGCRVCGKDFSDGRVNEGPDGMAYCPEHFIDTFCQKCQGCQKPIQGETINALGGAWHPPCFVCAKCQTPFTGSFFPGPKGLPYCERHYYDAMGLICASCSQPIVTGKCVKMGDQRYHPEHFLCSHCQVKLSGNEYHTKHKKPYCKKCHLRLFG